MTVSLEKTPVCAITAARTVPAAASAMDMIMPTVKPEG